MANKTYKLLKQADNHFKKGDLAFARQCYEKILAAEPTHMEAMNNLGVVLVQEGRIDEAIDRFHEVLRRDKTNADALANLKILEDILKSTILLNEQKKHFISEWENNGRPVPPPHIIKQNVLKAYAEKYNLRVLVETGTFYGDMVEAMKGFFDQIFSIELSRELFEKAKERFKSVRHIRLVHGDSGKEIEKILKSINQPALFWLDGHYSAGETARGEKDTPIYEELHHILTSQEQGHVIIIDDARCFGSEPDYPTIPLLEEFILSIRPDVDISVQDDSIRVVPKQKASNRLRSTAKEKI